ncbi:MAG TPA: polysaccharide deacetylase family protein [Opitutaceae bacterium]|nr:polysaccharide deacetylase family protein [Opitutaceae bacterium]
MSPSPAFHPVPAERSRRAAERSRPTPFFAGSPWVWWVAVLLFDLGALVLLASHRPFAALVIFVVPMPWLLPPLVVPSAVGFGPVVTHFSTGRREVWLTIDDGPDPVTTPPVLALLDAHRARATFFLIGAKAARHPELVAEILHRGHAVGNHTERHPCLSFWFASPRRAAAEIDLCTEALRRAGAGTPRWFRPPVGIKNPFLHRLLVVRGLDLVMWSARGYDCVRRPAAALARITRDLRPGAIILVHETSRAGSPRLVLLTQLLDRLAQEGYACVIPPAESLHSGRTAA